MITNLDLLVRKSIKPEIHQKSFHQTSICDSHMTLTSATLKSHIKAIAMYSLLKIAESVIQTVTTNCTLCGVTAYLRINVTTNCMGIQVSRVFRQGELGLSSI